MITLRAIALKIMVGAIGAGSALKIVWPLPMNSISLPIIELCMAHSPIIEFSSLYLHPPPHNIFRGGPWHPHNWILFCAPHNWIISCAPHNLILCPPPHNWYFYLLWIYIFEFIHVKWRVNFVFSHEHCISTWSLEHQDKFLTHYCNPMLWCI